MKLLQVAASIAPRDGGPATSIVALNRSLNGLGVEALILTTDADGPTARQAHSQYESLRSSGVRLLVSPRSRPLRLKNSWGQMRAIWREADGADAMHIHSVYLAHTFWAYATARARGLPYTYQPHGALEPYQRQFGRLHKAIWDHLIGRKILEHASALVAASPAERDNLQLLVPHASTLLMPLGVEPVTPDLDSRRRSELQGWLSVPRHQRILFLGRLANKKRPDLTVEAWNQCTSASRLALVGPAEDWTHASLFALARPDLRDRLVVADSVNRAGVAWLMDHAGIFVLPSENENFGITVAEAMAHGCAVVTTRQTAASDHVKAADAGLVIPAGDQCALTESLEILLRSPDLSAGYGRRGMKYAQEHLSWDSAALILQNHFLAPGNET